MQPVRCRRGIDRGFAPQSTRRRGSAPIRRPARDGTRAWNGGSTVGEWMDELARSGEQGCCNPISAPEPAVVEAHGARCEGLEGHSEDRFPSLFLLRQVRFGQDRFFEIPAEIDSGTPRLGKPVRLLRTVRVSPIPSPEAVPTTASGIFWDLRFWIYDLRLSGHEQARISGSN
jgi:hypothetical protein